MGYVRRCGNMLSVSVSPRRKKSAPHYTLRPSLRWDCKRRNDLDGETMIRAVYVSALCLVLLVACAPNSAQAQTPAPDKWTDYASGDYDIQSNITYAIANNTELKLDLYMPPARRVPKPTL